MLGGYWSEPPWAGGTCTALGSLLGAVNTVLCFSKQFFIFILNSEEDPGWEEPL